MTLAVQLVRYLALMIQMVLHLARCLVMQMAAMLDVHSAVHSVLQMGLTLAWLRIFLDHTQRQHVHM